MKLRAYITHKYGENFSDCADYFEIYPQNYKVAISDGVTQSIMPLEWAKILVTDFNHNNWEPNQSLSLLREKWLKEAENFLCMQRAQGKDPWMLENCLINRDGAGATFCGIVFEDETKWKASVLGDSCLVLIDENNKIVNIISSKEGRFDNRPDYFDSFNEQRGEVRMVNGNLQHKQKILLVSDPFSELFQDIRNTEEENNVIEKILSLNSFNDFLLLVDDFRRFNHMHNDDTTLVIIEYDGSKDFDVVDETPLENLIKQEYNERIQQDSSGTCRNVDTIIGLNNISTNIPQSRTNLKETHFQECSSCHMIVNRQSSESAKGDFGAVENFRGHQG